MTKSVQYQLLVKTGDSPWCDTKRMVDTKEELFDSVRKFNEHESNKDRQIQARVFKHVHLSVEVKP